LTLAIECDGKSVETIEGLENPESGELHPIQQSFIDNHALQCGFCTPGMIMSAKALLDKNPKPTEEEIKEGIKGNLCRCTGYSNIIKAISNAAK
jgi:carbon-monoxide dehydrogenase small subunit